MSSWINIKEAMQLYCESFFVSIERWRGYSDSELMKNRVNLLATICQLLHEAVINDENTIKDDVIYILNIPDKSTFLYPEYIR